MSGALPVTPVPATLLHEMCKRGDAERGNATECAGVGQGAAVEVGLVWPLL